MRARWDTASRKRMKTTEKGIGIPALGIARGVKTRTMFRAAEGGFVAACGAVSATRLRIKNGGLRCPVKQG